MKEVETRQIFDVVDEGLKGITNKLKFLCWCSNYHLSIKRLLFRIDNHAVKLMEKIKLAVALRVNYFRLKYLKMDKKAKYVSCFETIKKI